jgi:PAS domain S-box-containing protein
MKTNTQHINRAKENSNKNLSNLLIELFKKSGQEYFDSLVELLCKESNSTFAYIGEYSPSTNSVTTKALIANNEKMDSRVYDLKDTPCQSVVGHKIYIYPNNVQQLFPKSKDLEAFGIESYAGIPLYDINDNPVGIIVIMNNFPFNDVEQIETLLELVKSKTEFELERLVTYNHFALTPKHLINTFENFQDVFFWFNYNDKNEQIGVIMSPSVEPTFGYTEDEIKNIKFNDLYYNVNDRYAILEILKTKGHVKNYSLTLKDKTNTKVYVELDAEIIKSGLPKNTAFAIRGVIKNITEKKKEEQRTEIAYLIAEKSQRRLVNLNLLGEFIHNSLKEILPISNLFIATIDYVNKQTNFHYHKDDFYKEDVTNFSRPFKQNGFTEYVIQNKKLLNNSKKELNQLIKTENISLIGKIPERLIAIPLKSDGLAVGAFVVQSYQNDYNFSDDDFELLRFISSQIAVIIDRQVWQEKLIKNEEYYRTLVENSSEIICIINEFGAIEYISESSERIIGYLPYEIIGKNVSEFVNATNVEQLIQERIKNKKSRDLEIVKIYNKDSEKVYLELSIANYSNTKDNNRLIVNAKDITINIIAEKKKIQAQKKLETIHKIENALISDKPIKETLFEALQIIAKNIYDVDKLCVGLINQEEKALEIIAVRNKNKAKVVLAKNKLIPFNEMSSIKSILNKKPYYAKDLNKIKTLKRSDSTSNKKDGILSYYITPLIVNNKVIGTLNLSSSTPNYFDTIDKPLITEISTLLAIVVNNDLLKKDVKNRENDLTTIVNNTSEGIVKIAINGDFLVVNKSLCDMLGYSEKELLTKKYSDITYKEDMEFSNNMIDFIRNSKKTKFSFNKRYVRKNGVILDCRVSLSAINNEKEELDYYVAFIFDETERNQAIKRINDLRTVLDNSANVLYTSAKGIITDVNDKLEQLSGYNKKELIGKTPKIFNSNFHSREEWKTMWNTIKAGKIWQGEIRNKKKNGDIYWVFVTTTPIYNNTGEIEHFIAIQFDITQEKLAKTFLVQEVIEAQEQERERFAMEIHDGLGQVLLASKMNLNAIGDAVEVLDESTQSIYNKSMELLTEAVQEARNISHGLMSRVLTKFGLSYAINEIVNNINTSKNLAISFQNNIEDIRFNEELEMGLYRTLQELINNIIKHSQAKNASITINKVDNKLLIQIKDDGIGIKQGTNNNSKSGGIGLKNMKSRVEYLGGSFIIDNKIKTGTKIEIEVRI